MKLIEFSKRHIKVIAANAAKKLNPDTIAASLMGISSMMRSRLESMPDANMVGIDISIENRVASFRVNPAHRAPVIVIPDLEVPGIRAMACHSPSLAASAQVKVSAARLLNAR